MRRKKFDQIHRGLSVTALKVYDAVPIQEAWSIPMIYGEMTRKGISANLRTVEACVKQMHEQGILMRVDTHYQRESIEDVEAIQPEQEPIMAGQLKEPTPSKQSPQTDALITLGALANRTEQLSLTVRSIADELIQLNQDIEAAAITFIDQMESNNKELVELRQMQATLKKFMGA